MIAGATKVGEVKAKIFKRGKSFCFWAPIDLLPIVAKVDKYYTYWQDMQIGKKLCYSSTPSKCSRSCKPEIRACGAVIPIPLWQARTLGLAAKSTINLELFIVGDDLPAFVIS